MYREPCSGIVLSAASSFQGVLFAPSAGAAAPLEGSAGQWLRSDLEGGDSLRKCPALLRKRQRGAAHRGPL